MGSNRPHSRSSRGLRGPSATQVADYAGAAYPLRGSNPMLQRDRGEGGRVGRTILRLLRFVLVLSLVHAVGISIGLAALSPL